MGSEIGVSRALVVVHFSDASTLGAVGVTVVKHLWSSRCTCYGSRYEIADWASVCEVDSGAVEASGVDCDVWSSIEASGCYLVYPHRCVGYLSVGVCLSMSE